MNAENENEKGRYTFEPDYAVPPGETIKEWMEEHDVSLAVLCEGLWLSESEAKQLLTGERGISRVDAFRLSRIMGTPANFWLNREANYRTRLWRKAQQATLEDNLILIEGELEAMLAVAKDLSLWIVWDRKYRSVGGESGEQQS